MALSASKSIFSAFQASRYDALPSASFRPGGGKAPSTSPAIMSTTPPWVRAGSSGSLFEEVGTMLRTVTLTWGSCWPSPEAGLGLLGSRWAGPSALRFRLFRLLLFLRRGSRSAGPPGPASPPGPRPALFRCLLLPGPRFFLFRPEGGTVPTPAPEGGEAAAAVGGGGPASAISFPALSL